MTTEEELIIEMIKGKMGPGRLENIKKLSLMSSEFSNFKDVCSYIYEQMNFYIYDSNHETKKELMIESKKLIAKAQSLIDEKKADEAVKELGVFTYLPDFIAEMGHGGVDVRNEFEFYCIEKTGGNYYQLELPYSYISYLIGSSLIEFDIHDEAQKYLQNSINWNIWNAPSRFEFIESIMREFACCHPNEHIPLSILKDVKNKLSEIFDYIYEPFDFLRYLRKIGFVLIEEEKYEVARATFQYAFILGQKFDYIDNDASRELEYIDFVTKESKRLSLEEIFAILNENSINTNLSINVFDNINLYINDERNDKQLRAYLHSIVKIFIDINGGFKYRVASVSFNSSLNKTYDYFSYVDELKIGDHVILSVDGKEKTGIITDLKYVSKEELSLPFDKYKYVIALK